MVSHLLDILAAIAVFAGIVLSLFWFLMLMSAAGSNNIGLIEQIRSFPESLLFFLPGLALILIPLYLYRRNKQKKEKEE